MVCKSENKPSKEHPDQSAKFLQDIKNNIQNKNIFDDKIIKAVKYHQINNILDAIKNNLIEDNDISYIIFEADNISSGIDRKKIKR